MTEFTESIYKYGPSGPENTHNYSKFSTPPYLRGYARKMVRDLEKSARMYNGKKIRLYKLTGTERCSRCTNSITGEILHSNCPECNGTGKKNSWTYSGDYWAYVDFGPGISMVTETGNTTNPGNSKEQFIIIGAPELFDQDFFAVEETRELHKIFDIEPQYAAIGGIIVAQVVRASAIEDGSPEYRVVTW